MEWRRLYITNVHLHSHGRLWPRWSARMFLFGLELRNTNPRIRWNGKKREIGSKVSKQSNTGKWVVAIHKPFPHSQYLHSALIHLSAIERGHKATLNQPLTQKYICTFEWSHVHWPLQPHTNSTRGPHKRLSQAIFANKYSQLTTKLTSHTT